MSTAKVEAERWNYPLEKHGHIYNLFDYDKAVEYDGNKQIGEVSDWKTESFSRKLKETSRAKQR